MISIAFREVKIIRLILGRVVNGIPVFNVIPIFTSTIHETFNMHPATTE